MKSGLYNLLNESTNLEQRSSDKEKQILLPYVDKFLKDNGIVLKGDQKTEFENIYVLCFDVILKHYISLLSNGKEKKGGAGRALNALLTYNPPEILYRLLGGTFIGLALNLAIFLFLLSILLNDIGVNLTYEDMLNGIYDRQYDDLGNMPMGNDNAIALVQEQGSVGFNVALNDMFERSLVRETQGELIIDGIGNLANLDMLMAYFTSTLPPSIQGRLDEIAIQAEANMRRGGNQILDVLGNEGLNFLQEQMDNIINEEGEIGVGAWFLIFHPGWWFTNFRVDASRRAQDLASDMSHLVRRRVEDVLWQNQIGLTRNIRDYITILLRIFTAIGIQGTYLLRYLYAYMRRRRALNQNPQLAIFPSYAEPVDGGSKRKRKNKRSKGKQLRKKQSRKKTKKTKKNKKRSKSKK